METIRANRDPLFGGVNPEPIDQNLGALKRRVGRAAAKRRGKTPDSWIALMLSGMG